MNPIWQKIKEILGNLPTATKTVNDEFRFKACCIWTHREQTGLPGARVGGRDREFGVSMYTLL